MNREIKFRAFSVKSGMWDWDKLTTHAGGHPLTSLYSHDGWQVMQFTGLKDKNGVEIYEGDIVRVDVEQIITDTEIVASVEIRPEGVMFDYGSGAITFDACDCDTCEVIGNIYENPELLEK